MDKSQTLIDSNSNIEENGNQQQQQKQAVQQQQRNNSNSRHNQSNRGRNKHFRYVTFSNWLSIIYFFLQLKIQISRFARFYKKMFILVPAEHIPQRKRNSNSSGPKSQSQNASSGTSTQSPSESMIPFYPFPRVSARVCWKRRRYLWGVVGLHQEIEDFIKFMEPTQVEQAMRDDVLHRIKKIITDLWVSKKL